MEAASVRRETEERKTDEGCKFGGRERGKDARDPLADIVLLPRGIGEGRHWPSHSTARCRLSTPCDGS